MDEEEVAAVVCGRLVFAGDDAPHAVCKAGFAGDERSHSGQQPLPEKHCRRG